MTAVVEGTAQSAEVEAEAAAAALAEAEARQEHILWRNMSVRVENVANLIYCKHHSEEIQAKLSTLKSAKRRGRPRTSTVESDSDDSEDNGSDNGDMRSGKGRRDGGHGASYEGELLNGVPHGYGVFHHSAGYLYEGEWQNGRWHGYGALSNENDRVFFAGQFVNGAANGQGTYFHLSGATYSGRWKDNKCHGEGAFVDADGNKFVGTWKRNTRDGKGTSYYASGLVYQGEWRSNVPHGPGTLSTNDGFRFEGQLTNGFVEGRGHCTFSNGTVYKGNFRHGKKEGRGTLTFANGAVYEGSFRDDEAARGSIGTFTLPVNLECILDSKGDMHISAGEDHLYGDLASVPSPARLGSYNTPPPLAKNDRHSKRGRSADPETAGDGTQDGASAPGSETKKARPNLPEGVEPVDYVWMIPIDFGTDMSRVHSRAGFTTDGH